jgi:stress-induced morphogen
MLTPAEVKRRIEVALPGARVVVGTFSGPDHFEAVVEAPQFRGRSLVEQHQLVYRALDGLLGGPMHALALRTRPLAAEQPIDAQPAAERAPEGREERR